MKKTNRKLSLGKETLQRVTGAGITLIRTALCTAVTCGCPVITADTCYGGCTLITCGYANTCGPWGCQSEQPTCKR